jgi:acyl-coenzyme A synthetase/AMP-(fatty) acid ligase
MMRPLEEQLLTAPGSLPRRWQHDWSTTTSCHREALVRSLGNVPFQTSGTTSGQPATWLHTGAQLLSEVDVTLRSLPSGIDQVITTVDATSLYGYVLSILVPLRLGVPVSRAPILSDRYELPTGHTLVVTVATTWREGRALPGMPKEGRATFIHAGSLIPSRAESLVDRNPRCRLIELFGATESGLVADREYSLSGPGGAWRVVEDVVMFPGAPLPEGESRLVLESGRIGRPHGAISDDIIEITELQDWVTPVDRRRFIFAGRRDHICKPNGRALNLEMFENQLWELAPRGLDLACVPVVDRLHGEWVEVHVAADRPIVDVFDAALHQAARTLPLLPRLVTVSAIDRGPMGKVRRLRPAAA